MVDANHAATPSARARHLDYESVTCRKRVCKATMPWRDAPNQNGNHGADAMNGCEIAVLTGQYGTPERSNDRKSSDLSVPEVAISAGERNKQEARLRGRRHGGWGRLIPLPP